MKYLDRSHRFYYNLFIEEMNPKGGMKMEVTDMTEKEIQSVKMSTIYELRLMFTQADKKEYTTDEIVNLLDKIAAAKDQK